MRITDLDTPMSLDTAATDVSMAHVSTTDPAGSSTHRPGCPAAA